MCGVAKRKINPGKFEYLGACVADKEAKKKKCRYDVEAEEIEESEADTVSLASSGKSK